MKNKKRCLAIKVREVYENGQSFKKVNTLFWRRFLTSQQQLWLPNWSRCQQILTNCRILTNSRRIYLVINTDRTAWMFFFDEIKNFAVQIRQWNYAKNSALREDSVNILKYFSRQYILFLGKEQADLSQRAQKQQFCHLTSNICLRSSLTKKLHDKRTKFSHVKKFIFELFRKFF